MPLTLTITEGLLSPDDARTALRRLSEAMLRWHGLAGNQFMTSVVIGSLHVLEADHSYSSPDGPIAVVEWKVPPVAFASREIQRGYIDEATTIIHELTGGKQAKNRIWVNVVHAVDGTWGVAGHAMTSEELGHAIARG